MKWKFKESQKSLNNLKQLNLPKCKKSNSLSPKANQLQLSQLSKQFKARK